DTMRESAKLCCERCKRRSERAARNLAMVEFYRKRQRRKLGHGRVFQRKAAHWLKSLAIALQHAVCYPDTRSRVKSSYTASVACARAVLNHSYNTFFLMLLCQRKSD